MLTGCFVGVGCAGSTGRYASAAPAGTPATIKSSSFICAVGALCNGEGACAASAAPEASSAAAHTTEDCLGDRHERDRRISLLCIEEKEVDDILFHINRSFDGRFIFKDIRFNDNGKSFHFQERVSALKKDDFIHLLTSNGFIIDAIYGDFELNVYDDSVSDRLILIAKKNG